MVASASLRSLGVEDGSDPPKSSSAGFVVCPSVATQVPISNEYVRKLANIVSFLYATVDHGIEWRVNSANDALPADS